MGIFTVKPKLVKQWYRCKYQWEDMVGDAYVRKCHGCDCNVYDLTGLNDEEVFEFIKLNEGKVCAKVHINKSGKIVNGICSKGKSGTIGRICPVNVSVKEAIDQKIFLAQNRIHALRRMKDLIPVDMTKNIDGDKDVLDL